MKYGFLLTAGLVPQCEVHLMVQRGTVWKSAPGQNVTLTCPFKNCGQKFNITWCKFDELSCCKQIEGMPNVEITQSGRSAMDELISSLTLTWISAQQDGLYRCNLHGNNFGMFSHSINISVSGWFFVFNFHSTGNVSNSKCLFRYHTISYR